MIKLLIVDDEIEIRNGIRNKIDWEGNDIVVCGEAGNGNEALSIINEVHPDVLLVDVRMPKMNGLELVEYLSVNKPEIKSIILSGHDDFSYAQRALKLGAFDYLLKPCLPNQILETILKAKTSIEKSNITKEMYSNLKIKLNEALPLLKEKFLISLIKGEQRSLHNIQEKFDFLKINLKINNTALILMRFDNVEVCSRNYSYNDYELLKFAIKNISEELLTACFLCEVFENNDDIVVIINLQNCSEVLPHLNSIKMNIKNLLNLDISIGLGKWYSDICKIGNSYSEAVKAVETRFFLDEDVIVDYEDIKDMDREENLYPINEEKIILNCINTRNAEDIEENLNRFFEVLLSGKSSKDLHMKSALALLLSIYHLCIEKGISTEEIFGQDFSCFDDFLKTKSMGQLKAMLLSNIKAIINYTDSKKCNNKTVTAVIKYIDANYMKGLSLEILAKEVFISPTYLSYLFKQCQGISFVDYLNKVRLVKASELLKSSNMKTYEVSSAVGYSDEKYFSYVFKKYTGMTPAQYRDGFY
jgi:two-component system, response regulator YesN